MIWQIDARNKDGTLRRDFESIIKDRYLKAEEKPELIVVDSWLVPAEKIKRLNGLNIPVKPARIINV